ncbi:hypothetical protein GHK45_02385 [Sinorhizobium meliloti]|uniref:Uncharacterized protein n=1 Tax=Rhizobium meliloti TaxID=382 RepID=A0A6A7ZLI5_RHIML|nr:hypothetical protein [Sinorhizobium meliloti]
MNITLLVQFLALLEEMKTREEILPEFERDRVPSGGVGPEVRRPSVFSI